MIKCGSVEAEALEPYEALNCVRFAHHENENHENEASTINEYFTMSLQAISPQAMRINSGGRRQRGGQWTECDCDPV